MPKLTMLVGASGSGKSTEARKLLAMSPNTIRVNRDELRLMSLHKWRASLEEFIFKSEIGMVKEAAKQGYHVIVDDTNLTDKVQNMWETVAKQAGMTFEKKIMTTSLADCVAHDAQRKDHTYIGRPNIERQFLRGKLVDWTGYEVAIWDIDGTLADLEHRVPWITIGAWCPNCSSEGRPIYASKGTGFVPDGFDGWENGNWTCKYCGQPGGDSGDNSKRKLSRKFHNMFYSLCDYDAPIDIVLKWAREWHDPANKKLSLVVTGRSPENGTAEKTMEWLRLNNMPYDHIYTRRPFNHGPDTVEKQLILNDLLNSGLQKEQIKFIVDDRPSVIQMWRDNGLRVIPVRGRDDDEFYADIQKDLDINPPSPYLLDKV